MDKFSFLNSAHTSHFAEMYDQYLQSPDSLEPSWKAFFQGFDFGMETSNVTFEEKKFEVPENIKKEFQVVNLIDAYRKRGHLFTITNPVRERRKYSPTLDIQNFGLEETDLELVFSAGEIVGLGPDKLKNIIKHLTKIYCTSIGVEYMYIRDPERVKWIQNKININGNHPNFSKDQKLSILNKLNQAHTFENFLQKKYVGQKRFSLEGGESLIPAVNFLIQLAAEKGISEIVMGMSHRGRLNTLANIFGKSTNEIFSEFEGKDYVKKLMETMLACNESFKAKETVKVLVGESNSLIKQHAMLISDVFASGTDKSKEFWHAVIRQTYVKGLITKEIETYGILKVTDQGKDFLKKPYTFQLTEDHDYDQLKTESSGQQKGIAADMMLFKILKDHRKKIAKAKGLPPPIIFLEPSLIDMANQYPITMEEMGQIQGVGQGKAKKYGQSFIDIIKNYVEENEIERPSDMVVRSLANKSSNKIYIIQNIDKKLPLSDIASGKGITVDDLLTEIETIVDSGTKINLSYLINEILEDCQIEELDEVLTESDEASFQELREEFDEEFFTFIGDILVDIIDEQSEEDDVTDD